MFIAIVVLKLFAFEVIPFLRRTEYGGTCTLSHDYSTDSQWLLNVKFTEYGLDGEN